MIEPEDKVMYGVNKVKVLYVRDRPDSNDCQVLVEDFTDDEVYCKWVPLKYILPLKEKDELKKGDKFIVNGDLKCQVLSKAYDNYSNSIKYFYEVISSRLKGGIGVCTPEMINEVIYE